jgi:DNA-directed RNA polymerase-3 subunit RPC5
MNVEEFQHDPDDKVVKEFGVYLCNDHKAAGTQLCVLQQPLRPSWRPYEFEETQKARIKPNAMRFEIDIPLDTREDNSNYNQDVEEYKRIEHITLRSTVAENRTAYSLAVFQGDKLLLAPIDTFLQLRPQTNYLNVDPKRKEGGKEESDEEEEGEGQPKQEKMQAVEVDFKRRETEKQQQQRLNSYAYLSQKEEEEPWKELNVVSIKDSAAVRNFWSKAQETADKDMPAALSRADYLTDIAPSTSSAPADPLQDPAAAAAAAEAAAAKPTAQSISKEAQEALKPALKALFIENKHPVCNMANVRNWLQDYADAGTAKDAALLTDKALHEALLATGQVANAKMVYFWKSHGDAKADALRAMIVEMLREKDSVRRNDVFDAAKAGSVEITDGLYNRIIKELCMSRGNQWLLKTGTDL